MKQSFRFLAVGVLNTIVGYALFYICYTFADINYTLSLLISHIIGVIHSFMWNSKWTFNSGKVNLHTVIRFCSIYVVTFLVNLGLLSLFIEIIGITAVYAQLICLAVTTALSFFGHKYWSFK